MSSRKRRREVRAIRDRMPKINGEEMVRLGLRPPAFHLGIGWDGEDTTSRIGGLSIPRKPNGWWKKMKASQEEVSE